MTARECHQTGLTAVFCDFLSSSRFDDSMLSSKCVDNHMEEDLAVKPYDKSGAVRYHAGRFPPENLRHERIMPALCNAAASLGRYDAKITGMVNSDLFLAPLWRQDALASSRMEGTISTIEEIYRLESEEDAGTPDPYREARNDAVETYLYMRALRLGQEFLEKGGTLSEYLIRSLHQRLLSFGRGAQKRPGQYKAKENYIGDERTGVIHYVPIPPERLGPAMNDLVAFIGNDEVIPILRTAIAHVEFEALHPFEDGNGRVGRMLIPLMLWRLGVLSQPHFFVSGYFETNKAEYVDRMRAVSAGDDWTGWVIFFLNALHEQARVNIRTADQILGLHADMREQFREILNSQYHDQALDFVFASPVFRNDQFVRRSGIPASSARTLSRRLAEAGLLRMVRPASGRRAALYAFDPLLDLLRI